MKCPNCKGYGINLDFNVESVMSIKFKNCKKYKGTGKYTAIQYMLNKTKGEKMKHNCVNCNKEIDNPRAAVCSPLCFTQAMEYDMILKEFGKDIALQHWCYMREKEGFSVEDR